MKDQAAVVAVAESVERTWPVTDFERQCERLRAELERAIRDEKSKTDHIIGLQQSAERHGQFLSVMIGKDQVEKIAAEQNALIRAVETKRAEFRKYVNDEPAAFLAYKNAEYRRLQSEIEAKRERAKALAVELSTILTGLLGAKAVIDLQEKQIRERNRVVARIKRTMPRVNVSGIPEIAAIPPGNSLLSTITGILRDDPILRSLSREFLELDAKQREREAEREEFIAKQKEPPIF